jgi:hypothetical protein
MFRRRRPPIDRGDIDTIFIWLMRLDAKLDRIELIVSGEDPDDE